MFGAHRVPVAELIAVSGLVVGASADLQSEAFGASIQAATDALRTRYRFPYVEISPISYFGSSPDAGKTFITIDVVERGDEARLRFAPAPTGAPPDPAGLIAAWIAYEKRAWALQRTGALTEHACKGGLHCALGFAHPELAPLEDAFIAGAPAQRDALARVLRTDANASHRAAAAFVLAYAGDARQVTAALVPSIDDPNGLVRNNAVRVLVMIQTQADRAMLPLAPLLRAMRMPATTDRNKAAYALAALAKHLGAAERTRIARELGDQLVEMVAMQQPNNRDPAIDILKTLSGEDHGRDATAWRAWLARRRR